MARYNMTEQEVRSHLDAVVDFINEMEPDVLMLQEVDVEFAQCIHRPSSIFWTAPQSQLPMPASTSDFLPSDGMGKSTLAMPPSPVGPSRKRPDMRCHWSESTPRTTNTFYFETTHPGCRPIGAGYGAVPCGEHHLEAFSDDGTKRKQIDQFHDHLSRLEQDGALWVAGGDLNSIRTAQRCSKNLMMNARVSPALKGMTTKERKSGWMPFLQTSNSLMPLDEYQADNSPWFSYTGDPEVGWTRTLDYLFTNGTWVEGEVMQSVEQGGYEPLPLSDHAPIRAVLEVGQ